MNEQPAIRPTESSVARRRWWPFEIWDEYRVLFKSFVADFLIAGALVGGLQLFRFWITYLKFSEEETQPFLKVHYFGNLIAFLFFAGGFVVDIIMFMFARARTTWRSYR